MGSAALDVLNDVAQVPVEVPGRVFNRGLSVLAAEVELLDPFLERLSGLPQLRREGRTSVVHVQPPVKTEQAGEAGGGEIKRGWVTAEGHGDKVGIRGDHVGLRPRIREWQREVLRTPVIAGAGETAGLVQELLRATQPQSAGELARVVVVLARCGVSTRGRSHDAREGAGRGSSERAHLLSKLHGESLCPG